MRVQREGTGESPVTFSLTDEHTRAIASQALWHNMADIAERMLEILEVDDCLDAQGDGMFTQWTVLRQQQETIEMAIFTVRGALLPQQVSLDVERSRFLCGICDILAALEDERLLFEHADQAPESLDAVIGRWRAGRALLALLDPEPEALIEDGSGCANCGGPVALEWSGVEYCDDCARQESDFTRGSAAAATAGLAVALDTMVVSGFSAEEIIEGVRERLATTDVDVDVDGMVLAKWQTGGFESDERFSPVASRVAHLPSIHALAART